MIKLLTKTEYEEMLESQRLARYDRYKMQSVAKKALPKERVSNCLRRLNNGTNVQVWKHLETQKAFYNGLMVCGSVWNCPVCASKISEKRRLELQQAFRLHKEDGGKIAHLILTFRHTRNDILQDILYRFLKSVKAFQSGKRYQNIRKEMGFLGTIRAFEITWSERNGFHPHVHIAIFYKENVNLDSIYIKMMELWLKALKKNGLTAVDGIGLKLQAGEEAEQYFTKWSLEQELSKSHIKKGKLDSLTPFDFLREFIKKENIRFLALYREYAEALKGKTQLKWSNGLKAHFLILDKTDDEVAKEKTETADLLGLLSYEDWKVILKHDRRADFLEMVEKYGFNEAKSIILTIEKKVIKKESSNHEDSTN